LGVHRTDDRDVVDVRGGLREDLTDFDPRFAIRLELEWRRHRGTGFPFGRQGLAERFAGLLGQHRLVIEGVDV